MTDRPEIDRDPDRPEIDREPEPWERALEERLGASRPVPAAGFRGALARRLADRDPGYGVRPPRLRLIASAYFGAGVVVVALGALQAVGAL